MQTAGDGSQCALQRGSRVIRHLAGDVHFVVMRCESTRVMQTQTTNSDSGMDLSGHQSAVLEMKEALSLRVPSVYRRALRLLGNSADAEDASAGSNHSSRRRRRAGRR